MLDLDPQAQELNNVLQKDNPSVFALLSQKGKAMFFPHDGIVKQSREARATSINATIGVAMNDDGSAMRLGSIENAVDLPPAHVFPYAHSYGLDALRSTWQAHQRQTNPSMPSASLPIATSALTHALWVAGYLFVDSGDTIVLPEYYWENYALMYKTNLGARLKTYSMFQGQGLDLQSFQQALEETPGEKIVLLNFPHNPTGYSPTLTEADAIIEIIQRHARQGNSLVVLSDDAYAGFVYEPGVRKESFFASLANAHPNILAIKIDGASKECFAWGLRVGFIAFGSLGLTGQSSEVLQDKAAGVIRSTVSNVSLLAQHLVLSAITDQHYEQKKEQNLAVLRQRFEIIKETLTTHPEYTRYFSALPYNSAYFLCLRLSEGLDAQTIRHALLQRWNTGVVATTHLLRIAFSSVNASQIPQLFSNIAAACQQYDRS